MNRRPVTFRLPVKTIEQIKALAGEHNDSQAHIIILAIDRIWQQEHPFISQGETD